MIKVLSLIRFYILILVKIYMSVDN